MGRFTAALLLFGALTGLLAVVPASAATVRATATVTSLSGPLDIDLLAIDSFGNGAWNDFPLEVPRAELLIDQNTATTQTETFIDYDSPSKRTFCFSVGYYGAPSQPGFVNVAVSITDPTGAVRTQTVVVGDSSPQLPIRLPLGSSPLGASFPEPFSGQACLSDQCRLIQVQLKKAKKALGSAKTPSAKKRAKKRFAKAKKKRASC